MSSSSGINYYRSFVHTAVVARLSIKLNETRKIKLCVWGGVHSIGDALQGRGGLWSYDYGRA